MEGRLRDLHDFLVKQDNAFSCGWNSIVKFTFVSCLFSLADLNFHRDCFMLKSAAKTSFRNLPLLCPCRGGLWLCPGNDFGDFAVIWAFWQSQWPELLPSLSAPWAKVAQGASSATSPVTSCKEHSFFLISVSHFRSLYGTGLWRVIYHWIAMQLQLSVSVSHWWPPRMASFPFFQYIGYLTKGKHEAKHWWPYFFFLILYNKLEICRMWNLR